jgi:hypothetical protein
MGTTFILISILLPIIALFLGLFIFLKPALAIEIQRRFYEKINWRIEPISKNLELRNTKIIGLLLVALAALTLAYILLKSI